jgi:hypothetical protein
MTRVRIPAAVQKKHQRSASETPAAVVCSQERARPSPGGEGGRGAAG